MSSSVVIAVRLTPRASRDAIDGPGADGVLRARVRAAPVDGAANSALTRLFADVLGVPAGHVRLVGGAAARQKRLRIEGLDAEALQTRWPGVVLGRG